MEFPKKKVYIETTIPSVITARSSRDIINAYRQDITKFFWENERKIIYGYLGCILLML